MSRHMSERDRAVLAGQPTAPGWYLAHGFARTKASEQGQRWRVRGRRRWVWWGPWRYRATPTAPPTSVRRHDPEVPS